MKIEVGNICTLKLNSGEELIAKIVSVTDACVGVSDPVSVAPGPQGVGLVPSLFTGNMDKTVMINTSSIAMYAETDESVQAKYVKATTGIQVPDKKIVMG